MPVKQKFIDSLPIMEKHRTMLKGLGVDSPCALLGMIQASRQDFNRWMGEAITNKLIQLIEPQLSHEDRRELQRPVPHFSMGAAIGPAPQLDPPAMDFDRREELLKEIETLRRDHPESSDEKRRRIEQLENDLAGMY